MSYQYPQKIGITQYMWMLCPLHCGHIELPFHYMQCNNTILSDAHTLGIEKLERSLYKMNTSPSLLEAILQGIL
jgi:hypothetical protein